MTYSSSQIDEAVSTVHMNSRRQAKRNLVTNFANGDINFIGDCCFAYSGKITFNNVETTLMEWTSGPSWLKIEHQLGIDNYDGADMDLKLLLNDIEIMNNRSAVTGKQDQIAGEAWNIIIPPFTTFKATIQNKSNSSSFGAYSMITGKVYAGAEIIQGAI